MSYHVTIKKRWSLLFRTFFIERLWHEKGLGIPTLAILLDTGEYRYMPMDTIKEVVYHADYHSHQQDKAELNGPENPQLENRGATSVSQPVAG